MAYPPLSRVANRPGCRWCARAARTRSASSPGILRCGSLSAPVFSGLQDLAGSRDGGERRGQLVRQVPAYRSCPRGRPERELAAVSSAPSPRGARPAIANTRAGSGAPRWSWTFSRLPLRNSRSWPGKLLHVRSASRCSRRNRCSGRGRGSPCDVSTTMGHPSSPRTSAGGSLSRTRRCGHLDVAEDQVGVRRDRQVDPRDAVRGLEDVESARFQGHSAPRSRLSGLSSM